MSQEGFDVVVIGSGAAGSFATHELTANGMNVLLLEAGRAITSADFPTNLGGPKEKGVQLWARIRAALDGQWIQSRVAFYGQQQRHLFVKDSEHPYSTPPDKPFLWIRGKQVGGRLHVFGRVLLRWSDYDFQAAAKDGFGPRWPISYADLAPYYDRVEQTLQIRGCTEHIPNLPDSHYAGPSKFTAAEADFKGAIQARWPSRKATPWRYTPPNIKRIPQPILSAQETGRLTIQSDAVVRRILTDPSSGKATGVEFMDRNTRSITVVRARAVMVCASPIESVRLLLNSASERHPTGLGNSTGLLGRYFMDQVPSLIMGTVPGRTGWEQDDTLTPDPFYGATGGIYLPRYENLDTVTHAGFLRGFGYQGTIGRLFTPESRAAKFALMGFGEMLAHPDNRISLHPSRKDRWGVPIPHIEIQMRENEIAMLREQSRAILEMSREAGLNPEFLASHSQYTEFGRGAFPEADWISRALFRLNARSSMSLGAAIHESGGARMGSDPEHSVVNPYNQCWDAPNVFVADASAFPTSGSAGTTLTVMAMSSRASEYAALQLRAGRL